MVSLKKSQEMFHLRCYTLRKLFQFIDAGFQREPMSAACVKSSPDKNSLFFLKKKIATINHIHGFYLTALQKTTPPKSLHLPQLSFQINKLILAETKISRILSRKVYACK